MDNVTPIRSGDAGSPAGGKPPRRRRPPTIKMQKLRDDTRDDDGFSTLDCINGLRGVCTALDELVVTQDTGDNNLIADLCQAAKVLSSLLGDRVE